MGASHLCQESGKWLPHIRPDYRPRGTRQAEKLLSPSKNQTGGDLRDLPESQLPSLLVQLPAIPIIFSRPISTGQSHASVQRCTTSALCVGEAGSHQAPVPCPLRWQSQGKVSSYSGQALKRLGFLPRTVTSFHPPVEPGLSKQYYCFIFPAGEQQGCSVPISLETDVPAAGMLPKRPVSWGKIRCISPESLEIALIPVHSQSVQRGRDPTAVAVLPPPHTSTLGSPLPQFAFVFPLPMARHLPALLWSSQFEKPMPTASTALAQPTRAIFWGGLHFGVGDPGGRGRWDGVNWEVSSTLVVL